jgi:hypothetical protein
MVKGNGQGRRRLHAGEHRDVRGRSAARDPGHDTATLHNHWASRTSLLAVFCLASVIARAHEGHGHRPQSAKAEIVMSFCY